MPMRTTRRTFLQGTGASFSLALSGPTILRGPLRETLNVAAIGVGGRGWNNLSAIAGENLLAICDVDDVRAKRARETFPDVPYYRDYRELLAEHGDRLDAVAVSTPDHTHAPIALAAMRRGLHCYCEKPLTWSIEEARALATVARERGLVTQMGNQGSAADGFRRGVEALRAGVLGAVREVHVWTNRPVWPQAIARPTDEPEVPATLGWDLWLGPAGERPYSPVYLPFAWRGWHDFGTGALGDMACHTVNLPYRGLELTAPTRAVAETSERFAESYPAGGRVELLFPARGERPAVTLTWYEGKLRPRADLLGERELPPSGCLIVGERGTMFSPDDYGARQEIQLADGGTPELPEPTLPRSPGQHAEWLAACRGAGPAPMSRFELAGPFTEAVLVGDLAIRLGGTIEWDAAALTAGGRPEAGALIRREYRAGFGIEDGA